MKRIACFLTILLAGFSIAQAADTAACVKCHSPTTTTFPRIDGQTSTYLLATINDYATKARHSTKAVGMMTRLVATMDDATKKDLATYFAGLPTSAPIAGDAALIAKGEQFYINPLPGATKSCSECHGRYGEGRGSNNNDLNPRLAAQNKAFLKEQMANYKAGKIDNQKEMTDIATAVTAEQVDALVEYLQSLK